MDRQMDALVAYGPGGQASLGMGSYPQEGASLGSAGLAVSGIGPGTTEPVISHVGHGPKGYTRPDERILEDVCERLALAPMIDAREIKVKVKDGEVALTGEVENRQIKRMAEDAVFTVWGVKDVNDQIRIKPAEDK
jgi:hypothetical protein